MQFKTVLMIPLAAGALTLGACGSTQPRADAPADAASVAVSDEPVHASRAQLRVDGLGCPMCAESITLVLKGVDAVRSSRVDLSSGVVSVELDPGVAVTPAQLRAAVDDGGFTFRSVAFEK